MHTRRLFESDVAIEVVACEHPLSGWALFLLLARCSCRAGAVIRSGTPCTDPLSLQLKKGLLIGGCVAIRFPKICQVLHFLCECATIFAW